MARFDAVLTDIDGTMARSEGIHRDGMAKVGQAYYGVTFSDDELDAINGRGAKKRFELLQNARHRNGLDPHVSESEFRDHLTAYFLTQWKRIEAMPGASNFITTAHGSGMRTAAVTNSPAQIADVALSAIGPAKDRLEFVVSIENVQNGKPDPQGYMLGAKRLGVEPSRVLALEDSKVGVEAAKRAGMTVIQIQHDPAHIHPEADLVVPRLDDPRVTHFVGLKGPGVQPYMAKVA